MIPIRLKLRNFMCYRENVPALDFTGIHTVCISGDNGNGKSALIDAMTWALWGESRAGKNSDSLISQGQSEMEVEFEFAIGKGSYRILRKHFRPRRSTGSGQTILEFQIATSGDFRSISAEGVSQTQRRIEETLHLDYDTFINSALVLQGRADEFTMKRPAERIQVLGNILGFSLYDELAKEAKDRADVLKTVSSQLDKSVSALAKELTLEPETKSELNRTHKELQELTQEVKETGQNLTELRRAKEGLEAREKELNQLEERTVSIERDRNRWESQIVQHRLRLKNYGELALRREEICGSDRELTETKRLEQELSQKLRDTVRLTERKHQLEMRISELGQDFLTKHTLTQQKLFELETESEKLPRLKDEWREIQLKARGTTDLENNVTRRRKQNEDLRATIRVLKSNVSLLQQEIAEVNEKIALLVGDREYCPLCESPIGEEGLKRIQVKYASEKAAGAASLSLRQQEITLRQKELETSEKEFDLLENRLRSEQAELQRRLSLIEKEIRNTEEKAAELKEVRKTLAQIEESLARKDYAISEEKALFDIENEIARLSYNGEEHDKIKARLTHLEPYGELKRKLDEAESLSDRVKEELESAAEAVRELNLRLESDIKKKTELVFELTRLPELKERLRRTESEYESLVSKQKEFQEKFGEVKGRLKHLTQLRHQKQEKETELGETLKEEQIYRELTEAFGKKGIQTMLIEFALPELETQANRLLSRMTDNRMHLKFETQRLLRKGDISDTLDITISDELGTRSYEMFSGGEAFRINFAIRVALARLLTQQSGAPLQTLIIDEGFGTQDVSGIEKIKEAISAIQDDFHKILVITHIEELRDAFPTRITVVKTPKGSTIETG